MNNRTKDVRSSGPTHVTIRAHSQYEDVSRLRGLQPGAVLISASDALGRCIRDDDMLRIFNSRGVMVVPARVTQRIMPVVVDIPQGARTNC